MSGGLIACRRGDCHRLPVLEKNAVRGVAQSSLAVMTCLVVRVDVHAFVVEADAIAVCSTGLCLHSTPQYSR
jgi:hypothetical protein